MAAYPFTPKKLALILGLTFLLICSCRFADRELFARPASIRLDGKLDFVRSDGSIIVSIDIEIAETAKAHRTGLMRRQSLKPTYGMLFIYKHAALRSFWMHNTPVSLDMIFVDHKGRIIHMAEATIPMSKQKYHSKMPAQYVVEVPAGFVKYFNIEKGMRIEWQRN